MRRLIHAGPVALILSLSLAAPVAAGTYEDALAALERKDYATALRLLEIERFDVRAQRTLGDMYARGLGVPHDFGEAVVWYRKAAEQDDAVAQNTVGEAYYFGEGVQQDYTVARMWFRMAADHGNARSQSSLGTIYEFGRGVPQDYAASLEWYRKADNQGDARAQLNLGWMYENAWGVPQDHAVAFALFTKAADQGFPLAQYALGVMYEEGRGVSRDYAQAYKWYTLAAANLPPADTENRAAAIKGRDRIATKMNPSQETDPKLVAAVQQSLNSLGFDSGPLDGRLGLTTQNAIRQYERSVGIAEDGQITPQLAASLQTALAISKRQASNFSPASPQNLKLAATGSGFYVSNAGLLLTNYHVVQGCKSVSIPGGVVSVIAADPENDLAVLSTPPRTGDVATLRINPAVRAGERVVAVGFPLAGFLAGQANVTTGDVSSLAGIRDDSRYLQITAPVQTGNSGGPLFDASGNIIGVVSAKLDAIKVAGVTGDIPENVNFALNISVVRAFLDSHGIPYQTAESTTERSAPDIGDSGKSITQLVECWQ